jgi:hypothetical protein
MQNGTQGANVIHVATENRVVRKLQSKFYGSHQRGRRNISKRMLRHAVHINHESDAPARPDVNRRAAAGDAGKRVLHGMSEPHRIFGNARPQ